jgi:hypothetical protein
MKLVLQLLRAYSEFGGEGGGGAPDEHTCLALLMQ